MGAAGRSRRDRGAGAGIGEAAIAAAIAFAKERQAFGRPIADYEAIQWMLADAATELEAARVLTWKAADAKDRQERIRLEASMAKLAASEAAHRAADKSMQILASAGYRRGSLVERLFRDVRATEIYQGTSEAQRLIIAEDPGGSLGQGGQVGRVGQVGKKRLRAGLKTSKSEGSICVSSPRGGARGQ